MHAWSDHMHEIRTILIGWFLRTRKQAKSIKQKSKLYVKFNFCTFLWNSNQTFLLIQLFYFLINYYNQRFIWKRIKFYMILYSYFHILLCKLLFYEALKIHWNLEKSWFGTIMKNNHNFVAINSTLLKIYIQVVSNPLNNYLIIKKVDLLWQSAQITLWS